MPVPPLEKPAPVFKGTAVIDGMFKEISLNDYKGKYVVFFFYPLDSPLFALQKLLKINCAVIACSTDSEFSHLAWINTNRKEGGLGLMNIPILSDKSMKIARDYGVLNEESGVPYRGLFIIDGNGECHFTN
nr:unnamed protein product [Callosobruchus analis]